MDRWKLVAVLAVGALAGIVGTHLTDATDAHAQTAGYRECFVGRQESVDINNDGAVQLPDPAHSIQVPAGWTAVSGAGANMTGYVLFCR